MRRAALLTALLALVVGVVGVGCKVVTGQHDCTYDPACMQLPPTEYNGRPPHPVVGTPYGAGPATVMTAPATLPVVPGGK